MNKLFLFFLTTTILSTWIEGVKYEPNWDSLDSRPLPEWFDAGKIGIFVHFGVYSVPSFVSEWFWCYWKCPNRIKKEVQDFMRDNFPPDFTYQDFARDLTMEFFDATEWAELFKASGAKYAVLTTKHHEGYTLWPSKFSYSWNAMDVGPKRDVVREFSAAVNKSGLRVGLYHSLFEWFNPLYLEDQSNNFTTNVYPAAKGTAELYELVRRYQPDLIWSDGDAGPVDYWDSKGFLAWLYNESPVKDRVVVNDRWGAGTSCKHGGYFNCADRYNPAKKLGRKWENAMTLDKRSWGYRRNAKIGEIMTERELLLTLADTVSKGGNLLVDVGPTKEGTIPVIFQERLLQMGRFLSVNGEAVYDSRPWRSHNDTRAPGVRYTTSGRYVYAFFFDWPPNSRLNLGTASATPKTQIKLLGFRGKLKFEAKREFLSVELPAEARGWKTEAWVLKLSHVLSNAIL